MKIWFEPIPKFDPDKSMAKLTVGSVFVAAEGVLEVQKRRMKSEVELFDFVDVVGLFKRENSASNFSVVENDLLHLNGCKVRVKIELLELPKIEKVIE